MNAPDIFTSARALARLLPDSSEPVRVTVELADGREITLNSPPAHSVDFTTVRWRGSAYYLTGLQAAVVRLLWEARDNGTPDVRASYLLETVGSASDRIQDVFKAGKDDPKIWGELLGKGSREGTVRLYFDDKTAD